MFEVLGSVERSYSLGSTFILLATVWSGLAILSYKNRRTVNFFIEIVLMTLFYVVAFTLLLNAIFYQPLLVVLKFIAYTFIIGVSISVMAYIKKNNADKSEKINEETEKILLYLAERERDPNRALEEKEYHRKYINVNRLLATY